MAQEVKLTPEQESEVRMTNGGDKVKFLRQFVLKKTPTTECIFQFNGSKEHHLIVALSPIQMAIAVDQKGNELKNPLFCASFNPLDPADLVTAKRMVTKMFQKFHNIPV